MAYGSFTGKLEAINQMLSTIGQSRLAALPTAGEGLDAQKILEEVDRAVQSEGWHFNMFHDVPLDVGQATLAGLSIANATQVTTTAAHYLVKGENIAINDAATTVASVTSANIFVTSTNVSGSPLKYSKRIETPATALNVDFSTYRYSDLDPVVRGRFIYDKNNATYEFQEDLKAIITYQIAFEQASAGGEALPEYARRFITMRAARVFAQRHVGDPELVRMAALEEQTANAQFIQAESENSESNIFSAALPYYTISRGRDVQTPSISNLYKV